MQDPIDIINQAMIKENLSENIKASIDTLRGCKFTDDNIYYYVWGMFHDESDMKVVSYVLSKTKELLKEKR